MKITKEIQFIQNRCIEKAHPWLSLEEALVYELKKWCVITSNEEWDYYNQLWEILCHDYNQYYYCLIKWDIITISTTYMSIFWLPPCLARVLNGLNDGWLNPSYWYLQWCIYEIEERDNWNENIYKLWKPVCIWESINPDWSPATLFDQSEETISAIANEMWYTP